MAEIAYEVVLTSKNGQLTPLTWDKETAVMVELTTDSHELFSDMGLSRGSTDSDIDAAVNELAGPIAEQIGAGSVTINLLGERLREIRDAA